MNRRAVAARMAMNAVAQFTDMAGTRLSLALLNKRRRSPKVRHTESWAVARRIHVTSIDTASITNAVNSSEGGGTLRCRTGQGVGDPTQSDDVARVERRHHEHHRKVSRSGTGSGGSDDKSCNGDVQREGNVEVTLAGAIGMPGIGEGANNGETVWRSG